MESLQTSSPTSASFSMTGALRPGVATKFMICTSLKPMACLSGGRRKMPSATRRQASVPLMLALEKTLAFATSIIVIQIVDTVRNHFVQSSLSGTDGAGGAVEADAGSLGGRSGAVDRAEEEEAMAGQGHSLAVPTAPKTFEVSLRLSSRRGSTFCNASACHAATCN